MKMWIWRRGVDLESGHDWTQGRSGARMCIIVNSSWIHAWANLIPATAVASFWLKGLDPICAAREDKPHVLLIAGVPSAFDSGSGVLSAIFEGCCATSLGLFAFVFAIGACVL